MKQQNLAHLAPITLALVLLSACAPVTREGAAQHSTAASTTEETTAAKYAAPQWSYTGDTGPTHWGKLSPEYALCATGAAQSPIAIEAAAQVDLANLVISYQPSALNILNNGHTIQVEYDPGSYLELDGKRYELKQFHFHAPSEHEIDGKAAAAELHLVNAAADGQLAVVGVLLEAGAENSALQPVWEHLPATAGPVQTFASTVDAAALLPGEQTTYRYSGSLTTPPCTEGVSWLVMTTPLQLSADQLAAFTAIVGGNNRPVQPLADRALEEDVTP